MGQARCRGYWNYRGCASRIASQIPSRIANQAASRIAGGRGQQNVVSWWP
ncbi:hypothetical protein [Corynebacterium pseudodiphtheriticum]|nr:hypothetical protein [Corynebacterium pseudodiphtheriticum]